MMTRTRRMIPFRDMMMLEWTPFVAVGALAVAILREAYIRRKLSGAVVWPGPAPPEEEEEKNAPNKLIISEVVDELRRSFEAGVTQPYAARLAALQGLLKFVESEAEAIVAAGAADLGKPRVEAMTYDVYTVRSEILHLIGRLNHLAGWHRVGPDATLVTFPSRGAYLVPEPLGVALVLGTWNFAFMLTLVPLAGAIAAGNAVVLKPCGRASKSAALLASRLHHYVSPRVARVVGAEFTSDRDAEIAFATDLLRLRFDKIFFTGSSRVGKIVAKAAAEHLTPCVLELGGKNPVYVHSDADLAVASKRLVWGRMLNAGQQCVAPDYVLCHETIADDLAAACKDRIKEAFGDDPKSSPDFGRVLDVDRLDRLLKDANVVCGGNVDRDDRYVAPTVLKASLDSDFMKDEIFGPILLLVPVKSPDAAIAVVNDRPKPLSLYVFSKSMDVARDFARRTSSGGLTVNDTIFHATHPHLPFGGVGASGTGNYHGDATFEAFSHYKPVLVKDSVFTWANFFVYPPWTPLKSKLVTATLAPGLFFKSSSS
ncbi:hypothetical protein CTAYLR_008644 [Chrysophaeum taylorii]|uniref:Aldehyde dehydrogenase n=1 Tax=Chrysophaeum taylorii TaxID=2483200 RepID=A0AAD7U5T9_9STRA|nr:hypothetical protein CTAYLR_008644 [Chrysophaeum taylorii]